MSKRQSPNRMQGWKVPLFFLAGFLLCVAVIDAVFFKKPKADPIPVPYTVVGYRPGAKPIFGNYMVAVDLAGIDDIKAYDGLQQIARKLCQGKNVCLVHFWDDETKAARTLPMTDNEARSKIAGYSINQNNGNDRFVCHPFGEPGQRCAQWE